VPQLLASADGAFDVLVYVDTSKDKACRQAVEGWAGQHGVELKAYDFDNWPDGFHYGEARAFAKIQAENTGADWCFWLDLDDVLQPGCVDRIRAQAEAKDVDCWGWVYEVKGTGKFMRERMTRPTHGKWRRRIHELMDFKDGTRMKPDNECVVVHMPQDSKSNHAQHIKILWNEMPNLGPNLVYLAKEHKNSARYDEAEELYKLALEAMRSKVVDFDNRVESHNALTDLAKLAHRKNDLPTARRYFLEAIECDPQRREGYFYLAEMACVDKDWKAALGWIRAANAQPKPNLPLLEDQVYDNFSMRLHWRVLARCHEFEEANNVCQHFAKFLGTEDPSIKNEMEILNILASA
tara:strand:+ start:1760 stop:2812 length:1053 start_codon:yes stop_codon:yes gene_type:complete